MKISLTAKQINKMISRIPNDRINIDYLRVSFISFSENIISRDFDEKIETDSKEIFLANMLKKDKAMLKAKLIELNVKRGIHNLLAKLESLKTELYNYEALKINIKSSKKNTKIYFKESKEEFLEEVKGIKNSTQQDKIPSASSYWVFPFTENELNEKIKILKKEIDKVQDSIDAENNKEKIEIEISDETAEFLGLN